jgi:DNA repair exonuclease SbcCD ATPase subunit
VLTMTSTKKSTCASAIDCGEPCCIHVGRCYKSLEHETLTLQEQLTAERERHRELQEKLEIESSLLADLEKLNQEGLAEWAQRYQALDIWLQVRERDIARLTDEIRWAKQEAENANNATANEREKAERLERLLRELHTLVWGECSSLLNEDSGGDAGLDIDIRLALQSLDVKGGG